MVSHCVTKLRAQGQSIAIILGDRILLDSFKEHGQSNFSKQRYSDSLLVEKHMYSLEDCCLEGGSTGIDDSDWNLGKSVSCGFTQRT